MQDRTLSITDFLTDGSLARLCESAERLLGRMVVLRDPAGASIVTDREHGWEVRPPIVDADGPVQDRDLSAALEVDGVVIGHLVLPFEGRERTEEEDQQALEFIRRLSATVCEICDRELAQRHRVEELQALYRLSSMLVGVGTVEEMIEHGLTTAVELLGADAGLIRLIDPESGQLEVAASASSTLDDGFDPASLPTDEDLDQCALGSEVVTLGAGDEGRADALREAMAGMRLASMIRTGLVFRGRPIGTITLFHVDERTYRVTEQGLVQSVAQQLAAAITNAELVEAQRMNRRVNRQLKLAGDVQRRMLPEHVPSVEPLDIAAIYEPCFELGGDFYDLFDLEGHLGILVGDVVGKGVAAALLMSHVRASLRAHARDLYDLDEIIARTNQALCRDTMLNEFATVFYGVIDPYSLRMTYCNAGHDLPLISHRGADGARSEANMSELSAGGMVVGVEESQRYQRGSVDLQAGDVLIAFSDGLPDTLDFEGRKFTSARVRRSLIDTLTKEPDASAERICRRILWDTHRFAGLKEQTDDTTLVVVRVRDDATPRPTPAPKKADSS